MSHHQDVRQLPLFTDMMPARARPAPTPESVAPKPAPALRLVSVRPAVPAPVGDGQAIERLLISRVQYF